MLTIQQHIITNNNDVKKFYFNNVEFLKNKKKDTTPINDHQDIDSLNEDEYNFTEANEEQKNIYDAQKKEKRTLESVTRRLQEARQNGRVQERIELADGLHLLRRELRLRGLPGPGR